MKSSTYQSNGQNVNLTGSPDYAAKILYIGDPGKGCSDNPYAQFNTAAVTGPSYNSLGTGIRPEHPFVVPRQNRGPVDRAQH